MTRKRDLPIGVESFQEMRKMGFYYVDKTGFIKTLLENWGKVRLFTRPRRFGKTLNMDMLRYFFEFGCDEELFAGLEIAKEKELCDRHMGKYPVISVSLKEVTGSTCEEAKRMLRRIIGKEALRFQFLLQSERLTEIERQQYRALVRVNEEGIFTMALIFLRECPMRMRTDFKCRRK